MNKSHDISEGMQHCGGENCQEDLRPEEQCPFDEEKEIESCHLAFSNDRNMKASDWTVFRAAWLACARLRVQP